MTSAAAKTPGKKTPSAPTTPSRDERAAVLAPAELPEYRTLNDGPAVLAGITAATAEIRERLTTTEPDAEPVDTGQTLNDLAAAVVTITSAVDRLARMLA